MKYKAILHKFAKDKAKLHSKTNLECEKRLRQIVSNLKNVKIAKIEMGMGAWSLSGDKIPIVYEDNEEESEIDIQEIVYWLDCDLTWYPKQITKSEISLLSELTLICDWLVEITGGFDMEF